MQSTAQSHQFL